MSGLVFARRRVSKSITLSCIERLLRYLRISPSGHRVVGQGHSCRQYTLCFRDGWSLRGIDPETGNHFDDTKRYIDAVAWLSEKDRRKIYEGNARRVYKRLKVSAR
jgi:hypothetical protein